MRRTVNRSPSMPVRLRRSMGARWSSSETILMPCILYGAS